STRADARGDFAHAVGGSVLAHTLHRRRRFGAGERFAPHPGPSAAGPLAPHPRIPLFLGCTRFDTALPIADALLRPIPPATRETAMDTEDPPRGGGGGRTPGEVIDIMSSIAARLGDSVREPDPGRDSGAGPAPAPARADAAAEPPGVPATIRP